MLVSGMEQEMHSETFRDRRASYILEILSG